MYYSVVYDKEIEKNSFSMICTDMLINYSEEIIIGNKLMIIRYIWSIALSNEIGVTISYGYYFVEY